MTKRSRLARTVARLRGWDPDLPNPSRPSCSVPSSYEQVTRRGLEDLSKEVERLELKVNGILVGVVASVLVELVRAVLK